MGNEQDFEIENGRLLRYTGNQAVVIIPSGVTLISNSSFFRNRKTLTGVTIPDSITEIETEAFRQCENLYDVIISEELIARLGAALVRRRLISDELIRNYLYTGKPLSCPVFEKQVISVIRSKPQREFWMMFFIRKNIIQKLTKLYSFCRKMSIDEFDQWIEYADHHQATECMVFLLNEKKKLYTEEQLEKHHDTKTEIALGLRKRTLSDWRKIYRIALKGDHASISSYKGNVSMEETLIIPAMVGKYKVSDIRDHTFSSVNGRLSVYIEDGIQSMHNAFVFCPALTDIYIPNSITEIEESSFRGCRNLKNFFVSEDHPTLRTIQGNLYNREGTILYRYAPGKTESYFEVPNGATIMETAFENCTHLQRLKLPDSTTRISTFFLCFCDSLHEIIIPEHTEKIGHYAFYFCENLTRITIRGHQTTIDDKAFEKIGPDPTICAPIGSRAQKFAHKHGFRFIEI